MAACGMPSCPVQRTWEVDPPATPAAGPPAPALAPGRVAGEQPPGPPGTAGAAGSRPPGRSEDAPVMRQLRRDGAGQQRPKAAVGLIAALTDSRRLRLPGSPRGMPRVPPGHVPASPGSDGFSRPCSARRRRFCGGGTARRSPPASKQPRGGGAPGCIAARF